MKEKDNDKSMGTEQNPENINVLKEIELLKESLKKEIKDEIENEKKILSGSFSKKGRKKLSEKNASMEEMVEVQLFKDGRDYKDDVFVAVNGENCLIKRGVPVKIKRKFALVLDQSQIQDVIANEYAERMQEEYRKQE